MDLPEDIYHKKTLIFRAWKRELAFRVSQDLFSSFDIDKGTRLLIRTIVEAGYPYTSVLDVGCGYGPIGLTLKNLRPEVRLHMVDRDALAVEYARQNTLLNGIEKAEIYGSLGYDDVRQTGFDLIVSNIPGKAGAGVISYLLKEARRYLEPDGIVAVVVVNPIAGLVREMLDMEPGIEIIYSLTRSEHTVFHYRFTGEHPEISSQPSFERGVYDRKEVEMEYAGVRCRMKTVYGLTEFDSLHHATEMLVEALGKIKDHTKNLIAYNPGQGHAAVAAWTLLNHAKIVLVDRDLLALRASRRNLLINGCLEERIEVCHRVGLGNNPGENVIVGAIREDEGQKAYYRISEEAVALLAPYGIAVFAGSSTAVTRLIAHVGEKRLPVTVRERQKSHGYSSLVMEKV